MATQIKKEKKKTWDADAEMKRRREEAQAKKEQAKKAAAQEERDTNYRNATKPTGFNVSSKPKTSQPQKQTEKRDTSWRPSQVGPSASQKKEAQERYNRDQYLSRNAKRKASEEQIAKNQKKIEYKNSQMNNSVGYQNMMKRKTEAARRKAMEKAFGR